MATGDEPAAAFWKSADDALVAGDVPTLERLLREQGEMFHSPRPSSSRLLPVEYSGTDARTIILRNHGFESWDQFDAYTSALKDGTSSVARFEQAADAIVTGDAATLRDVLTRNPDLVRARSTRPHHSTLLHYIGANGVEGFRQRTPVNAVEIAELLLDAGADIDAVADMYGGGATTLGLVVTSIHPQAAGVLHALIDLLLARGWTGGTRATRTGSSTAASPTGAATPRSTSRRRARLSIWKERLESGASTWSGRSSSRTAT